MRPRGWLCLLSTGFVFSIVAGFLIHERTAAQIKVLPRISAVEERLIAFKWFSGLGYPDMKGRKFVDVATGSWVTYGNKPTINTFDRGFLIEEKENSFKVLTLSLVETLFEKTPPGTPDWKKVSFEAADLKEGAQAYLENLRAPRKDKDRQYRRFGEAALHSRTETFVVAWACWRAGLDDLARDLFEHAAGTPTGYGYNADDPPKEPLQKLVADDLAHTEMWRAVLAFGNPEIPRTELKKRFDHIVRHYPESEHHKDAKATVELLTRMIAEDESHEKNVKKVEELDRKGQIAKWIFRLRNQNGHQFMQPGSCDIFEPFGPQDSKQARLIDWSPWDQRDPAAHRAFGRRSLHAIRRVPSQLLLFPSGAADQRLRQDHHRSNCRAIVLSGGP